MKYPLKSLLDMQGIKLDIFFTQKVKIKYADL